MHVPAQSYLRLLPGVQHSAADRAWAWYADAHLANGRWTLAVDVPEGLRCGNVYYGPVIPTHDVYSWDAVTLTGTLESTFDVGCDNAPGGTFVYPFSLVRL